ncbi:hypothetical protein ILYODFUR_030627 [Ilyodon furcidens]|uniref:Uncharacterized protein n=1 Tax=Ilyodon furcidens TaxID=33524 RepID=A0ABV0UWK7_9TELE
MISARNVSTENMLNLEILRQNISTFLSKLSEDQWKHLASSECDKEIEKMIIEFVAPLVDSLGSNMSDCMPLKPKSVSVENPPSPVIGDFGGHTTDQESSEVNPKTKSSPVFVEDISPPVNTSFISLPIRCYRGQ